MTNPAPEEPFPLVPPDQGPPPPFDDMVSFKLIKPINLAQLRDEIREAVRDNFEMAQVGPDESGPISESNPASLAVTPSRVPRGKVQKVIDGHQPSEGYNLPEGERQFAAVVEKVSQDRKAELSPEEMQVALRGLLLRSAVSNPIRRRRGDLLE